MTTRRRDLPRVSVGAAAVLGTALLAVVVAAQPVAPPDGGGPAIAPATIPPVPPPDARVRIVFTVIPSSKKATVSWGKKRLGVIGPHQPLVVQRLRDSGPLDVIVRADGCVPVQTRAYTFADNKVAVKLTPVEEKNTLLGYREELPPEPDGGMPPSAPPSAPGVPSTPGAPGAPGAPGVPGGPNVPAAEAGAH